MYTSKCGRSILHDCILRSGIELLLRYSTQPWDRHSYGRTCMYATIQYIGAIHCILDTNVQHVLLSTGPAPPTVKKYLQRRARPSHQQPLARCGATPWAPDPMMTSACSRPLHRALFAMRLGVRDALQCGREGEVAGNVYRALTRIHVVIQAFKAL